MALFAAGEAPDQRPVARIEFGDAGFLLDDLRAVQAEARFAGARSGSCTGPPRSTCRHSSPTVPAVMPITGW